MSVVCPVSGSFDEADQEEKDTGTEESADQAAEYAAKGDSGRAEN